MLVTFKDTSFSKCVPTYWQKENIIDYMYLHGVPVFLKFTVNLNIEKGGAQRKMCYLVSFQQHKIQQKSNSVVKCHAGRYVKQEVN